MLDPSEAEQEKQYLKYEGEQSVSIDRVHTAEKDTKLAGRQKSNEG